MGCSLILPGHCFSPNVQCIHSAQKDFLESDKSDTAGHLPNAVVFSLKWRNVLSQICTQLEWSTGPGPGPSPGPSPGPGPEVQKSSAWTPVIITELVKISLEAQNKPQQLYKTDREECFSLERIM